MESEYTTFGILCLANFRGIFSFPNIGEIYINKDRKVLFHQFFKSELLTCRKKLVPNCIFGTEILEKSVQELLTLIIQSNLVRYRCYRKKTVSSWKIVRYIQFLYYPGSETVLITVFKNRIVHQIFFV